MKMHRTYLSAIIAACLACCIPTAFAVLPATYASAGSADRATLLVYTNVPWQGTITTPAASVSISNFTANSSYSFDCRYNDTYEITLHSGGRSGTGYGVWTVADLIEDGRMLNVGVNRLANGSISISGECHDVHGAMSDNGMVSFTTDKPVYRYGEPIRISGVILPDLQKNYVLSSSILDSDGMVMQRDSTICWGQNSFYFYVHAYGGLWKPGRYRVVLEIAKSSAVSDIVINPSLQNPTVHPPSGQAVPAWFKNTARWWSEGKISDGQFEASAKFLISQNVMRVPYFPLSNISRQSLLSWARTNAGAWSDGQITDEQFVNVLEYLDLRQ